MLRRSARGLAAFLILTACSGGSNATLEIEIAPSPMVSGEPGETACAEPTGTLPRTVDCVGVTVCERTEAGDCEDVPVLRPEDDHGAGGRTQLFISREGTASVSFDVRLEPGRTYELEIVAYDERDGTPFARGRTTGITRETQSIRVRLEPFGTWSCAGPGAVPRALHQAVAIEGGDVLLLGGVTGASVAATSVESGAALQRVIEVYDVDEGRFVEVTGATDTDDLPGFGAVFHTAYYVGPEPDGRHRIRSIGGFAASGDNPAARFDAVQGLNHYNSPLLPGAQADVRDSVDIFYDPRTRTATIESVEPGIVPRAGFDAVSEPDPDGLVAVALGIQNGGGTSLRPRPELSGRWYAMPVEGFGGAMSMPLISLRFGASASRLSASTILVWGGNVDELTADGVTANAGEILGSGAVSAMVPGLPPPTALHTATAIDGGVLIAGGLVVAPVMGMSGGITTAASPQPLTVISLDSMMRPQGVAVPIDGTVWSSPILHAATALEDESVILTGGATRMETGTPSTLWQSAQAIRVARDATDVYAAAVLDDMIVARWGHQVTPLPFGRVLVTGGFVREDATLRALATGEVLLHARPPSAVLSCGTTMTDAGRPRDAGAPDAISSPDASDVDAAPDPGDAG